VSEHICFNLGRVRRRLNDYYERKLSAFGLTVPQFFVFNALWKRDGIEIGELGNYVYLDSSTLTGIIDRMERDGYVVRRPNPKDRRAVFLFLTDKARQMGPTIMEFADELDSKLRRSFPADDVKTFEDILKSLAEKEL
jgi:DNA-binding MarR family transcriptional regulator